MATMEQNARTVWVYFVGKGWEKGAVAGLLANMQVESNISPDIHEISGGGGYGLVQWTPGSKLTSWATARNKDYRDIKTQMERIQYEVDNGIQWIATSRINGVTFKEFTKTKDPGTAARQFLWGYERPNELYAKEAMRIQQANYWYNKFKNVAGDGSGSESDGEGGDQYKHMRQEEIKKNAASRPGLKLTAVKGLVFHDIISSDNLTTIKNRLNSGNGGTRMGYHVLISESDAVAIVPFNEGVYHAERGVIQISGLKPNTQTLSIGVVRKNAKDPFSTKLNVKAALVAAELCKLFKLSGSAVLGSWLVDNYAEPLAWYNNPFLFDAFVEMTDDAIKKGDDIITNPNYNAGGGGTRAEFIKIVLAQQGKQYVWGGKGPDTFDCAGLFYYAATQVGLSNFGGWTGAQVNDTNHMEEIKESELRKGDLIYYGSPPCTHVTMFIENGKKFHASSPNAFGPGNGIDYDTYKKGEGTLYRRIKTLTDSSPGGSVGSGGTGTQLAVFPVRGQGFHITQGENGQFSHMGSLAMDIAMSSSRFPYYAPCDCHVVKQSVGAAAVVWESDRKVKWANGTEDYINFWTIHDWNSANYPVGTRRNKGALIGHSGAAGNAFGDHLHIECARGKFTGSEVRNGSGVWMLQNQVHMYDVFSLTDNTDGRRASVLSGPSYPWKNISNYNDKNTSGNTGTNPSINAKGNYVVNVRSATTAFNGGVGGFGVRRLLENEVHRVEEIGSTRIKLANGLWVDKTDSGITISELENSNSPIGTMITKLPTKVYKEPTVTSEPAVVNGNNVIVQEGIGRSIYALENGFAQLTIDGESQWAVANSTYATIKLDLTEEFVSEVEFDEGKPVQANVTSRYIDPDSLMDYPVENGLVLATHLKLLQTGSVVNIEVPSNQRYNRTAVVVTNETISTDPDTLELIFTSQADLYNFGTRNCTITYTDLIDTTEIEDKLNELKGGNA